MHNFRDLNIWKKSIELSVEIYEIVKEFPSEERFNLISQITRASVSIPSNIAEGSSRISDKDFSRFLQMALGSAFELETQLTISKRLKYINEDVYHKTLNNITEIPKMINGFRISLRTK